MNAARKFALNTYRIATTPWRWHCASKLSRLGQSPISVLFFHRVADTHPNSWTIGTEMFQKQMEWIGNNLEFISLEQAQDRLNSGHNDRHAVHITFDDGYAENCEFAIPYLIENNIPCTYFVTLDNVVNGKPFPHDVEAGQPLPPNTIEQLREMATAGIEIGAHTRQHADLGKITDPEVLRDELVRATVELGELVEQPIRHFAFPYGLQENLNAHAFEIAKSMRLSGMCSAFGAYNFPSQDSFHIRRIHGDPEICRLKNWLTIDPRKLNVGRDVELPETIAAENLRAKAREGDPKRVAISIFPRKKSCSQ